MDFSVAVCTYNHAPLLRWTLEGLTRLAIPEGLAWELVVVDNNSTDTTRQTAEAFAGRLPLRYVFEPAQGLSHARRRAVRTTASEWLAFVDDDCWLDADWLTEAVRFCREKPMAGAVGGRVRLLWEAPPSLLARQCAGSLAQQDHGDIPLPMPSEGYTYLVGAGLVVRRAALAASGWLETRYLPDRCGRMLGSGGDSEMVLRIRNAGHALWYNPAMRLWHWIPRRRTTFAYLCRLKRGMGHSQVFLDNLAARAEPSFGQRARTMKRGLESVAHALTMAFWEYHESRRVSGGQRVALHESFGYLHGALQLARDGYQL